MTPMFTRIEDDHRVVFHPAPTRASIQWPSQPAAHPGIHRGVVAALAGDDDVHRHGSSALRVARAPAQPFAELGRCTTDVRVVKNTSSIWAKSPSSRMRCISTEAHHAPPTSQPYSLHLPPVSV